MFQEHALNLLRLSQYGRLLRFLAINSSAAKIALIDVSLSLAKQELGKLKRKELNITHLMPEVNLDNLMHFNWENTIEEAKDKCPVLTAMASVLLPPTSVIRRHHQMGSRRDRRQVIFLLLMMATN